MEIITAEVLKLFGFTPDPRITVRSKSFGRFEPLPDKDRPRTKTPPPITRWYGTIFLSCNGRTKRVGFGAFYVGGRLTHVPSVIAMRHAKLVEAQRILLEQTPAPVAVVANPTTASSGGLHVEVDLFDKEYPVDDYGNISRRPHYEYRWQVIDDGGNITDEGFEWSDNEQCARSCAQRQGELALEERLADEMEVG